MVYIAGINLVKEEKYKKCIQSIVDSVSFSLRVKNVKIKVSETDEGISYVLRFCFDCGFFYETVLNTHDFEAYMYHGIYGATIIDEIKNDFLFTKGLTCRR